MAFASKVILPMVGSASEKAASWLKRKKSSLNLGDQVRDENVPKPDVNNMNNNMDLDKDTKRPRIIAPTGSSSTIETKVVPHNPALDDGDGDWEIVSSPNNSELGNPPTDLASTPGVTG